VIVISTKDHVSIRSERTKEKGGLDRRVGVEGGSGGLESHMGCILGKRAGRAVPMGGKKTWTMAACGTRGYSVIARTQLLL